MPFSVITTVATWIGEAGQDRLTDRIHFHSKNGITAPVHFQPTSLKLTAFKTATKLCTLSILARKTWSSCEAAPADDILLQVTCYIRIIIQETLYVPATLYVYTYMKVHAHHETHRNSTVPFDIYMI